MTTKRMIHVRTKRAAIAALLALAASLAWPAREPDLGEGANAIVAGTNALRRSQGLESLTLEARLAATARDFALYLARTDVFEHTADGRHPQDRVRAHGYDYCLVAENIGYEYRSRGFATDELAHALVQGWARSPEHRKNMLDRDATEIGVALARSPRTGRYYGVQVFGRPHSASIQFQVENRARRAVAYRIGTRPFTLEPRVIRTHRECGASELSMELANESPLRIPLRDRDSFAVVDERGRLALRRLPRRLRRSCQLLH